MDLPALLARLVAADTRNPGGDEPALARLLSVELEARRPDRVELVEVPRPGAPGERGAYVLAGWGTPRLLVNAHLDTVPANAGWSADPHVLRRDGDRLIGLGACDTKGAIAAILSALDEARPRDTLVLFSGDEERSGTCARAFLESGRHHGLTHAVVCEPTSLRAGTRHRGVLALEASFHGAGGHSSRADQMPAPIAELARLAVAWADWGIARRPDGPPGFLGMCMNVAQLDGGVAFNVVPDRAVLSASVRPPPGADVGAVRRELEALAHAIVPAATLRAPVENPPFATRRPADFAPRLGAEALGPDGAGFPLGFWTEAAVFAQAGIDAVVFGPGDIAQAHAPDEWLLVSELEAARARFLQLFQATHGTG